MTMMSRDDAIRFNALVSFMLWLAYLACIQPRFVFSGFARTKGDKIAT